jgi:hypothetical protein
MMFAGLLASVLLVNNLSRLFLTQVNFFSPTCFLCLTSRKSCLILVTMIVTASSIGNLQAKSGLPLLNRVVGWSVLGKSLSPNIANRMTDAIWISHLECSSIRLSW